LFSWDIHTKTFAEGFRDKIFNTEIIAALEHALNDEDSYIRSRTVEIFTVPVAQGGLYCFYRIFILKD
jgi:hypothetical protein